MAKEDEPIYKIQTIQNLTKKYNKTAFQIILRWVIQRGISIIPKSVKIERMK
jgi:2,5-diketo-D-gluconate reductase A